MHGRVVLFAALFVSACQSREPMHLVGVSRGAAALRGEKATNSAPEVPSPVPPDFRTTLVRANRERFVAAGHAGGRFDADVYVTPTAKDAAFSFLGKVETGTLVVMEEFEHGKEGSGPTLMMEKMAPGFAEAHGDWRYAAVDGKAVTVGVIESCARCHDEAPHDHLFPVDP